MAAASGNFAADFSQQPPRPPEDIELKNIIDKLANFVARNGPEFEQMTMNKQRDNPKFQFLFGGEWHAYYKWRVISEHQGQGGFQPPPGGGGSQIPPLIPQLRPLMSVGNYSQPPPNLPPFPPPLFGAMPGYGPGFIPNVPPPLLPPSAPVSSQNQSPSLMLSTPPQHQAPPPGNQTTPTGPSHSLQLIRQELQTELDTYGVTDPLEVEFSTNVKRLMDSCSKDSIASGKSWIFTHARMPDKCAKIAKYILRKTLDSPGVGFSEKLHIIYLINDVIHHW
jgi:calcium homeostasis ER protein